MFRPTAIAGWRRLRVLQSIDSLLTDGRKVLYFSYTLQSLVKKWATMDSAAYYKSLERELMKERF